MKTLTFDADKYQVVPRDLLERILPRIKYVTSKLPENMPMTIHENECYYLAIEIQDALASAPETQEAATAITDKQILESVENIRKALATYYRLRKNNEPSHEAVKTIDHTIFNEEQILIGIANRLRAGGIS